MNEKIFQRCTNLKFLKSQIKTLPRKICDPNKIKFLKNGDYIKKKNFRFPYNFYLDLKYVCKMYGASFELREKGNPGYSSITKTIYMTPDEDRLITSDDISHFFTHELAHRIQHMQWENNKDFTINRFNKALLYERSAERLAYFINKKYFSHLHDFSHQYFSSYTTEEDISFLKKHLKGNLIKKRWRE